MSSAGPSAGLLTLVCRVFGFVHGDYSWASKVRFGAFAECRFIEPMLLKRTEEKHSARRPLCRE
jgi:hypothetical protein